MNDTGDATRRDFLKLAAVTAAATAAAVRPALAQAPDDAPVGCGKPSSDKRVGLATIGIGGQPIGIFIPRRCPERCGR